MLASDSRQFLRNFVDVHGVHALHGFARCRKQVESARRQAFRYLVEEHNIVRNLVGDLIAGDQTTRPQIGKNARIVANYLVSDEPMIGLRFPVDNPTVSQPRVLIEEVDDRRLVCFVESIEHSQIAKSALWILLDLPEIMRVGIGCNDLLCKLLYRSSVSGIVGVDEQGFSQFRFELGEGFGSPLH